MFSNIKYFIESQSQARRVKNAPRSIPDWVKLVDVMNLYGRLDQNSAALTKAHELATGSHTFNVFGAEIAKRGGAVFDQIASDPISNIRLSIEEMIKWKAALQCGYSHDAAKGYFIDAERVIDLQWNQIILPLIKDLDFTSVLDLACGHGRNTDYLRRLTKDLHLVDINKSCIDACRERFGDEKDGTTFHYYVTDGTHLSMLPEERLTLVYTWDSMVHFDKLIVRDYVKDIARVLKPGGSAFLHHSNYGETSPDSNWASNYGTRSDMSAVLMRDYAAFAGLKVVSQNIQGMAEGWGQDRLDCVSILRKL